MLWAALFYALPGGFANLLFPIILPVLNSDRPQTNDKYDKADIFPLIFTDLKKTSSAIAFLFHVKSRYFLSILYYYVDYTQYFS